METIALLIFEHIWMFHKYHSAVQLLLEALVLVVALVVLLLVLLDSNHATQQFSPCIRIRPVR